MTNRAKAVILIKNDECEQCELVRVVGDFLRYIKDSRKITASSPGSVKKTSWGDLRRAYRCKKKTTEVENN